MCESIDNEYLRSRWVTGNSMWDSSLETAASLSDLAVHVAAVDGIVRWKKQSATEVCLSILCHLLTLQFSREPKKPAVKPIGSRGPDTSAPPPDCFVCQDGVCVLCAPHARRRAAVLRLLHARVPHAVPDARPERRARGAVEVSAMRECVWNLASFHCTAHCYPPIIASNAESLTRQFAIGDAAVLATEQHDYDKCQVCRAPWIVLIVASFSV